jgi:hypothetical protein
LSAHPMTTSNTHCMPNLAARPLLARRDVGPQLVVKGNKPTNLSVHDTYATNEPQYATRSLLSR